MNRCLLFPLLAFTAFVIPEVAWAADTSRETDDVESRLAFTLAAPDGSQHTVQPGESELTVVCFLGTECPLARLYAGRLSALSQQFADRDVRFIGVNSNQQDSAADVAGYAENYGLTFLIVKDPGNGVADAYDAERTPAVFVLDRELNVHYRGRIDDQFLPGIARPNAQRDDLRLAIEELLSEKPVSVPITEAVGCLIGRVKQPASDSAVTYSNQVARVLQRNCVECHRAGEIGPFALTEYDEVVGWADMMLEVIEDGRMPPWHATADHAEISNARFIPEADKKILRDWVAAGAPLGDPSQLPPPAEFVTGWNLPREPDLVVAMGQRPFAVPADGTVEYQYFVVDLGFETDRWVTAAQVIPGNRAVVHHAIVFIRPPDGTRFRGLGWLGAYVPGQRTLPYAAHRGRRIPAGSKLVFQMHYTPTGTEQSDITKIGILFGDDSEITHDVFTVVGIDQDFEIPPFAGTVRVTARVPWFPREGHLLAVGPHMHLRGKSFQLATVRDGEREPLLDVPRYDFNWQHSYQLAEPLPLAEIDALEFVMTFDNSEGNPFNPDPSQYVTWGDQTWEEMAVAFFDVAEPREPPVTKAEHVSSTAQPDLANAQAVAHTDRFFARFDTNRDGIVERSETPFAVQAFGFWQYDDDRDGRLTRGEVLRAAERRLD